MYVVLCVLFLFKQKTAYEWRMSDWSSDVCSSDLRFGRIDRIGSTNTRIQLVNFWPNMELDEYLDLESRVSGRMVLLDVSATGEENVIEFQAGNQMNDLEYRRHQLQKMQDAVIDLEDLSSGVSIADLTLNDFRIALAGHLRVPRDPLATLPLGDRKSVV